MLLIIYSFLVIHRSSPYNLFERTFHTKKKHTVRSNESVQAVSCPGTRDRAWETRSDYLIIPNNSLLVVYLTSINPLKKISLLGIIYPVYCAATVASPRERERGEKWKTKRVDASSASNLLSSVANLLSSALNQFSQQFKLVLQRFKRFFSLAVQTILFFSFKFFFQLSFKPSLLSFKWFLLSFKAPLLSFKSPLLSYKFLLSSALNLS